MASDSVASSGVAAPGDPARGAMMATTHLIRVQSVFNPWPFTVFWLRLGRAVVLSDFGVIAEAGPGVVPVPLLVGVSREVGDRIVLAPLGLGVDRPDSELVRRLHLPHEHFAPQVLGLLERVQRRL